MPASGKKIDLFIYNIGTLVTMRGSSGTPLSGADPDIGAVAGGAVAVGGGVIVAAGADSEVRAKIAGLPIVQELDAQGRLVTPGFVDPHTHLVHAGSRESELEMKLQGVSYMDILRQGGGILRTVRETRAASEEALYDKATKALSTMLLYGTTTVEAKSGYGLTVEDELKQLRVASRLNAGHPIDIVSTFMGAHAIPPEYKENPDAYVDVIINEMLPEVDRQGLAEYCDIFCEHGVFSVEQSRRILIAARVLGFGLKIHADEIESTGGAELAGELGCVSAEHLVAASDEGLEAMRRAGVIAVCLPGTSFNLRLEKHARARTMIGMGIPVALSTDYNPGSSPLLSMQMAMTLACLNLRMTPEEAIAAMTINAAHAIGRADSVGSLEPGKQADVVLFNAPNLAYLPYHFGTNHVHTVIKRGSVVVSGGRLVV